MKTIIPHPSTILSVKQLSSLLCTSLTQAPNVCRYLVLVLGGIEADTIFRLKSADVFPVDGSIDLIIDPTRHHGASRIALLPALQQAWLLLFAGGKPEEKFIPLPESDILHQLGKIRKQLGVEWTDATMRRTSFLLLLSHGMPCQHCLNALGFSSSFPTQAGEREALPLGAWRRLLPTIVLTKGIRKLRV